MSATNPFSNVLEHIVSPKIISGSSGYKVAVDLVDVDIVYARQAGSTAVPISQIYATQIGDTANNVEDLYVNRIHWNEFVPTLPSGGSGGTASFEGGTGIDLITDGNVTTIASLIRGGTGVTVGLVGNEYVISSAATSTVGVTGGPGITVGKSGNTYTVASNLAFIAGSNMTIGANGNTYTFSAAGSTGVASLTGPTGNMVLTTPSGIRSTPNVVYDGTNMNLPTTKITTADQGGILQISTFGNDTYIESGVTGVQGSGNYLYVTQFGEAPSVLAVDTINSRVGVNNDVPLAALDVNGQTQITFNASNGAASGLTAIAASGATGGYVFPSPGNYVITGWGSGGPGNGGVGGAGAYVSMNVNVASGGPYSISWEGSGGGPLGGNALRVTSGSSVFMYVGGGGGGVTGGTGAAAGEPQGQPTPEGGLSALLRPYPGGGVFGQYPGGPTSYAEYDDTTNWVYTIGSSISVTGGTVSNGQITGLTSIGQTGTRLLFSNFASQVTVGTTTTYTVPPNTNITIEPVDVVFSSSGLITSDNSIAVASVASSSLNVGSATTGITGNSFALYDNWPSNTGPNIQGNAIAYSSSGFVFGTGNVTWKSGNSTFSTGGITWTFALNGTFQDAGLTGGNQNIVFLSPTTMTTSYEIPTITGAQISTDSIISLTAGTTLGVVYRKFKAYGGEPAFGSAQGVAGGGYVNGRNAARVVSYPGIVTVPPGTSGNMPAGGGAGSSIVNSVPGITPIGDVLYYGGNGAFPYITPLNPLGRYGAGGTGSGNTQFLVVQKVLTNQVIAPALVVDGSVSIIGDIEATGGLTLQNNGNVGGSLTVQNNATVGGSLTLQNALTVNSAATIQNDALIGGSLTVQNSLAVNGGSSRSLTLNNATPLTVNGGPVSLVNSNFSATGGSIVITNSNLSSNSLGIFKGNLLTTSTNVILTNGASQSFGPFPPGIYQVFWNTPTPQFSGSSIIIYPVGFGFNGSYTSSGVNLSGIGTSFNFINISGSTLTFSIFIVQQCIL